MAEIATAAHARSHHAKTTFKPRTASTKLAKRKYTGGFKTWTEEHIAAYRKRHELGTTARLALELLLNVGSRRAAVVKLGPQHLKNSEFMYRTQKTGTFVEGVPLLP